MGYAKSEHLQVPLHISNFIVACHHLWLLALLECTIPQKVGSPKIYLIYNKPLMSYDY